MKGFLLLILMVCLCKTGFGQKYYYKPEHSTALDTINGRKLLKQCSRSAPENVKMIFVVTPKEKMLLEKNFKKILRLRDTSLVFGKNKWKRAPKIRALDSMLFQYTGVVIDGRKYIYINAIAYNAEELKDSYKDWQTNAIIICDGGESFWGALFDINSKSFSQLSLNGP